MAKVNNIDKKTQKLQEKCWLYAGSISRLGYGMIWGKVGSKWKAYNAHRAVYEHFNGPIPDKLTIDHLCRITRCVNPDHLEAVTLKENLLRGNGPGAINARKTHCIRGHVLAGENLILQPYQRRCRICLRSYAKRRKLADAIKSGAIYA